MPARRCSAATALALLALGLPAWPQGGQGAGAFVVAGPPDQEVFLEADKLVYGWETQVLQLAGHVVARRGVGIVRAARGTLDRAHGLLTMEGGVLGVQGKDVFLAQSALVDLNARTADLKGAVLYLKERPPNPDNPTAGKNALVLHAERVRQLAGGGYEADEVTLTPCDCAGEPDYELLAHTAKLREDRADLSGTRLKMFGAPIPLFPLSLPLTQRQSGLLAPILGFGGTPGFGYSQPVFLTLGQSNDVTLTPGFYTGGSSSHSAALGQRTVRGPALDLEWQYAPVAGTAGLLAFDLLDDLDQRDSKGSDPPAPGERAASPGRGFGGVRGIARYLHRSETGAGILALQGALASDVLALSDLSPQSLVRTQDTLRTDAGFWRARGPLTLGVDAALLQDLRLVNGAFLAPDRRLFGPEANSSFHRLPALFAQLAPTPLGPALFSAEASAAQFVAFVQPRALERSTGFAPNDPAFGPAPAIGNAARAPALRLDAAPRVTVLGPRESPLDLRGEIGARADGWLVEGESDRSRTRAYALAGAHAGLPLERAFDGGYLHRLEPALDVRALTRPLQSGGPPIGDLADAGGAAYFAAPDAAEQGLAPGAQRRDGGSTSGVPGARRAYDEIDFAAPATGAVEAVFSLSQALWSRSSGYQRVFRLDLTQDALLWANGARARIGEASAHATFSAASFGADAEVRWDWTQHALSVLAVSSGVRDARGDELHASTGLLAGSSSERLRGGIDELFSAARLATAPGALQGGAGAGGSAPLPLNLRLAYDAARYLGPDLRQDLPNWTHSGSLVYETACHCAGLRLTVAVPFRDTHLLKGPTIHLTIDLKSLGSFATF